LPENLRQKSRLKSDVIINYYNPSYRFKYEK
jgi:hypothetical protein